MHRPTGDPKTLSADEGLWVDIGSALPEASGHPLISSKQAEDWSLVLTACGIPHQVERPNGPAEGWRIRVPSPRADSAIHEIVSYEKENREPPVTDVPLASFENTTTTLWVLLGLTIFHFATELGGGPFNHESVSWSALGSARGSAVFSGQWWRLITALTLHADALHLLSNIVIGGYFFVLLCRELGSGLGWGLTLLSGGLGNLINTLLHGPGHDSLGASTAVFGAVGLLVGLRLVRRGPGRFRRVLLPLGGGLALLSFFGTGGERTDLGAHLFGFSAGLGLGAAAGGLMNRWGVPGKRTNRLLACVAALTPLLAWSLALR
jgi:rhomboid protease GluP